MRAEQITRRSSAGARRDAKRALRRLRRQAERPALAAVPVLRDIGDADRAGGDRVEIPTRLVHGWAD